jgi:hypothetical protein
MGLDFITVGVRRIENLERVPVGHLSIQFYQYPCEIQEGRTIIPAHLKPFDSFELLSDDFSYDQSISVIHRYSANPEFERVLVGDVKGEWERIKFLAENYQFAEQEGLYGSLQNWPNSKYFLPTQGNGNNSNTFIRFLARGINKYDPFLNSSNYPGAEFPSVVPIGKYDYPQTNYYE